MRNWNRRIERIENKLAIIKNQERYVLVIRWADPDEAEVIVLAYGFSKEEREKLQARYAAESRRQSHECEYQDEGERSEAKRRGDTKLK
jgi:hypothetical protein